MHACILTYISARVYIGITRPARLLGFQNFIPPFARARAPREVLRGVNFASGAAGIREETGNNLGDHASLSQQVTNFGNVVQVMLRYFRGDTSLLNSYLGRCIFFSGMGSNDYLNNYFMSNFYTTSSDYTPKAFASVLLQDYANQLAKMYTMGARKVVRDVGRADRVHTLPAG
ncbi:unnamed protein product [Linum tenue]|uniref:GDSL esterase/lipase n=1 Tax=Linum tenue TaxID=586396 RepID=A0AAV0KDA0_9ROSI|nr:unnamed protein product [Linum tenue]